jgi:3-oxoacyl-[acyl-carrier-protein] synthase II
MTKVFISGLGAISSLGNSPDQIFDNLEKNERFFKYYPSWEEFNGLKSYIGAPAFDYEISSLLPRKFRRSMSPMSEMSYLATIQALDQAKISLGDRLKGRHPFEGNQDRSLIVMGNTAGSPIFLQSFFEQMIEKKGPEGQLSTSFLKVMNHTIPTNISLALGFSGPILSPSSACSTSSQSLILAADLIKAGLYDLAVVGGSDELHPHVVSVFDIVHATSSGYNKTPDQVPGPFDEKRDGLVVSEGAGVVILESEDHLEKRKGVPLAEYCGGSFSCSGQHMTQPKASDMAKTMKKAIDKSHISLDQINYINAHGTGTLTGDKEEGSAIKILFEKKSPPISSLKGHFGHSLAACGTLEVISIVKMMEHKKIIGTRNLKKIDPALDSLNILKENKKEKIHWALSNNFAFGGVNTSMVLKGV